ncbi:hypothetical protein PR048_032201 [Dryococelus australis]|uniref:Uncharacterized protein n=1 Tax=Dryococelus australis TaxID=614101 RepID=A0ABQ9G2E3_9NEOP|nr:hypothetical protein PR048_032201 [Dryococelus australis]
MEECCLRPCFHPEGETIQLTKIGLNTVIEISRLRNDGLDHELAGSHGLTVHVACRKNYARKRTAIQVSTTPKLRRTKIQVVSFRSQCLFCSRSCVHTSKLRSLGKEEWSAASTLHVVASVRQMTEKRGDCEWAKEVLVMLTGAIDLVAEDGRYHRHCCQRLQVCGSPKPGTVVKSGRLPDTLREDAFQGLCQCIEDNEECRFTISELVGKLAEISPDSQPYSEKHLKRNLTEHYGENVNITHLPGKQGIVCFSGVMNEIITDKWYTERRTDEKE